MDRLLSPGLIALAGALVAVSQLVLRHGMRQIGQQQLRPSWQMLQSAVTSPWIVTSLALGLVTFAVYAYLLSRIEISLAAPATNAVFYLVTFVVATVWLGEHVTFGRAAAVPLLILAMWLLSRS